MFRSPWLYFLSFSFFHLSLYSFSFGFVLFIFVFYFLRSVYMWIYILGISVVSEGLRSMDFLLCLAVPKDRKTKHRPDIESFAATDLPPDLKLCSRSGKSDAAGFGISLKTSFILGYDSNFYLSWFWWVHILKNISI